MQTKRYHDPVDHKLRYNEIRKIVDDIKQENFLWRHLRHAATRLDAFNQVFDDFNILYHRCNPCAGYIWIEDKSEAGGVLVFINMTDAKHIYFGAFCLRPSESSRAVFLESDETRLLGQIEQPSNYDIVDCKYLRYLAFGFRYAASQCVPDAKIRMDINEY